MYVCLYVHILDMFCVQTVYIVYCVRTCFYCNIIIIYIVLDFIYIYNFYFLVAMLRSEGNLLPLHLWSPSFSSTIVLYNENICFVCLSLYIYDVN